ncbi:MAG TPA: tripartite tricarboxylate transporter TctB family protein [Geminicoccaceae bacterium]|nr:tripartite tricarboxylate transporter TctB family protein [Geminicoccaceae bacterium]
MSDRLLGGIAILLALAMIVGAWQIETGPMLDPLGPRTFPIIIAVLLAISSVYLLARPDPEPDWPSRGRVLEIALATVVMIAYALLLEPLGFIIASALAVFVLCWRLGGGPGTAVVVGIGVALLIYVVFHLILGLSLPRGPLPF